MNNNALKIDFSHTLEEDSRDSLLTNGYVVLKDHETPWSTKELDRIVDLTSPDSIPYERNEYGDTGEKNPVSYYRILHPSFQKSSLPECFNILINETSTPYLSKLTGISDFVIDRCQVHRYTKGDFIARHTDIDSCPDYIFSFMLLLTDNYEGRRLRYVSTKSKATVFQAE